MSCYLCAPPQPQSTDFTQYNSYGDMCGGGRGERRTYRRGPRAILLPISPELFSISNWARYLYIYGRAFWYICILIHAACGQGQAVVVDRSQAVVLTAKPLTVSLIFCPMLSCRVSGMSLICFFTWHASSPRTTYLLACSWVTKRHLAPECTLSTPATCLQHCWINVNYRACGAAF